MRKVLTKDEVGGSYLIDSIQRVENHREVKVFIVTFEHWTEPHTVSFIKAKNGYYIKDYTLGKQSRIGHKWSDLRNLTDYFNDIDIAEHNFSKGYGKNIKY